MSSLSGIRILYFPAEGALIPDLCNCLKNICCCKVSLLRVSECVMVVWAWQPGVTDQADWKTVTLLFSRDVAILSVFETGSDQRILCFDVV